MRSFISLLFALHTALAAPVFLDTRAADSIPGSWIVRVHEGNSLLETISRVTAAVGQGASAKHTFDFGSFKGFSIDGVGDLKPLVADLASILSIERNTVVRTSALVTQEDVPSYGLARISSRQNGATSYIYDSSAGEGTYAYIIDTVSVAQLSWLFKTISHARMTTPTWKRNGSPQPSRRPLRASFVESVRGRGGMGERLEIAHSAPLPSTHSRKSERLLW
jgi:hypothetical protein